MPSIQTEVLSYVHLVEHQTSAKLRHNEWLCRGYVNLCTYRLWCKVTTHAERARSVVLTILICRAAACGVNGGGGTGWINKPSSSIQHFLGSTLTFHSKYWMLIGVYFSTRQAPGAGDACLWRALGVTRAAGTKTGFVMLSNGIQFPFLFLSYPDWTPQSVHTPDSNKDIEMEKRLMKRNASRCAVLYSR